MANEVQQMTVGVELELNNFTAKLDAISKALSGIGNVELIPSQRLKEAQKKIKELQDSVNEAGKFSTIAPVNADAVKNINAATQALKKLKAEYTDTALVAKAAI